MFWLKIDSISLFIKNSEIEFLSIKNEIINKVNIVIIENIVNLIDKLNISLEANEVT